MALLAPASSSRIDSVSPANLELLGSVPVTGPNEIAETVRRAREVSATWAAMPVRDRRRHLLRVRSALVERGGEIVDALVAETGKPASDGWQELLISSVMVSYAAKAAERLLRPERVGTWPLLVKRAWVELEPYGVVATITPWNWPLAISMQTIPFALAAGNVVVNKPSEYTPLAGQALADVINSAGIELVHVVQGDGRSAQQLIRSGVDKIAFTGSGATAVKVLSAAAEHLVPVVMELGGKDSLLVCEDANLRDAARAAAASAFANAGQTCVATERIIVADAVYDRFVDEFLAVVRSMTTGAGPVDHLGAVVRPQQLEVLESRIADAVSRGAKVLAGGRRRTDLPGWYFEPTVLADVDPDSDLIREESFGPVVSLIRAKDDAHAIELTNSSRYGLNGSVFTGSKGRGRRIAAQLVTGGVQINDVMLGAAIPNLPFGGVKASGYGRVQGAAGLREFCRSRSVVEPRMNRLPSMTAILLAGQKPSPALLNRVLGVLYGNDVRGRISALRGR